MNSSSTVGNLTNQVVPLLLILSGFDPIATTLATEQLTKLLPTVNTYLDPLNPSMIFLPADSMTYNGLKQALRWREADDSQYRSTQNSLIESVEMYQALSFLGEKSESHHLVLLEKLIQTEIERGLSLEDVQKIWNMRHYPYTGRFINVMLKQLVTDRELIEDDTPGFFGRSSADLDWDNLLIEKAIIFKWIGGEQELCQRLNYVQAIIENQRAQAKRDRRMAIVLGECSPSSSMPVIINQARQACSVRARLITISK